MKHRPTNWLWLEIKDWAAGIALAAVVLLVAWLIR